MLRDVTWFDTEASGPVGSPETSVSNHLKPRNNPEDRKINFNRGEILKCVCKITHSHITACLTYIFTGMFLFQIRY
jgi:hypothetical protein